MFAKPRHCIVVCWLVITELLACACHENSVKPAAVTNTVPSTKNLQVEINLLKLLNERRDTGARTVQVAYDPVFKSPKAYQGFPFQPLVDSIARSHYFDTTGALIVFTCTDGYHPMMDLSKVFGKKKAYIVYRDVSQPPGRYWDDSVEKKITPYYLVWEGVEKGDNSFMWPYGLTGFTLASRDTAYASIYPFGNPFLQKGFYLFRDNCLKCHSINKVGGTIGPEFNVPKNITEYWTADNIMSFAKNPRAFRYNTRMPAITDVSDDDLSAIVSYLVYMKDSKLGSLKTNGPGSEN